MIDRKNELNQHKSARTRNLKDVKQFWNKCDETAVPLRPKGDKYLPEEKPEMALKRVSDSPQPRRKTNFLKNDTKRVKKERKKKKVIKVGLELYNSEKNSHCSSAFIFSKSIYTFFSLSRMIPQTPHEVRPRHQV